MYACLNIKLYLWQIYYVVHFSPYLPQFIIKSAVWILVGKLTPGTTKDQSWIRWECPNSTASIQTQGPPGMMTKHTTSTLMKRSFMTTPSRLQMRAMLLLFWIPRWRWNTTSWSEETTNAHAGRSRMSWWRPWRPLRQPIHMSSHLNLMILTRTIQKC